MYYYYYCYYLFYLHQETYAFISICLSVIKQDYAETTGQISMKLEGCGDP